MHPQCAGRDQTTFLQAAYLPQTSKLPAGEQANKASKAMIQAVTSRCNLSWVLFLIPALNQVSSGSIQSEGMGGAIYAVEGW